MMEQLYQLSTAVSKSDRKYKYSKVLEFLERSEVDSLGLTSQEQACYGQYRERLKAFNREMFKAGADFKVLLADLQTLREEVLCEKGASVFLKKYTEAQIIPKTAYCHYKLGNYIEAELDLKQKFSIGYELFNEGYYFQFFDLLEQILNLNKVLLAQQRTAECVHNWTELFKFLINGHSSPLPYLQFDYAPVDMGVFKILKEYTILNFLNIYISGYMKFGVYPNPCTLFSPWYHDMEVHTSERLAVYRYIAIQENGEKLPLQKLIGEVVEFTQLFESSNYLGLRCSLIALLVTQLEGADQHNQQIAAHARFLRDYLTAFKTEIEWVSALLRRLERLIPEQEGTSYSPSRQFVS